MAKTFRKDHSESFPHIITVRTVRGEEPHVAGTGLQVWQLVRAYRALGEDAAVTADHFEFDLSLVEEAVEYARLYPDEIERAILEQEELAELARRGELPGVELITLPLDDQ